MFNSEVVQRGLAIDPDFNSVDSDHEFNSQENNSSKTKLYRRLGGAVLAGISIIGAGSSSMLANYTDVRAGDVSLVAEIAYSDACSAVNEVIDSQSGSNGVNARNFLSRFRLANGLMKNSDLGWYASVWPSSIGLEAMYDTALLENKKNYYLDFSGSLKSINENYWSNSIFGQSGYDQGIAAFHSKSNPPLVDDNLWMGLIDMGAFSKTHNVNDLNRAKSIFKLAISQWDQKRGGVYWMVQLESANNHIRAAVSNASVVSLGVELYLESHNPYYLRESVRIFNWINKVLLDPSDGLYNDHVTSFGYVDPIKYTYVQGIMIGAMVSLNQVKPLEYPLSEAISLAQRSMIYFKNNRSYGDPAFDAIWAQNLLRLAYAYNEPNFTKSAKSSIDLALQASPKNPRSLLYAAGDVELQDLSQLPFNKYKSLFR